MPDRPPVSNWPTTLIAIAAGVLMLSISLLEQERSQRRLAETLVLGETLDGTIISAIVRKPEVTDEDWQAIKAYDRLISLSLARTSSVAGGLEEAAAIPRLRQLALNGATWLKNDDLEPLVTARRLVSLDLDDTSVSDACLSVLSRIDVLQNVSFAHCWGITDASLDDLQQLSTLRAVTLAETSITLDGFERFRRARPDLTIHIQPGRLTSPTRISMFISSPDGRNWLVSDADGPLLKRVLSMPHDWFNGLGGESSLRRITSVRFSGPEAPGAVAAITPLLPVLRDLYLPAVALTALGESARGRLGTIGLFDLTPTCDLGALSTLPALHTLELQADIRVSPETLRFVAQIPGLQSLRLSGSGFSDAAIEPLTTAESLTSLVIDDAPITDAGVEPLFKMAHLREIDVTRSNLSSAMQMRLREKFAGPQRLLTQQVDTLIDK